MKDATSLWNRVRLSDKQSQNQVASILHGPFHDERNDGEDKVVLLILAGNSVTKSVSGGVVVVASLAAAAAAACWAKSASKLS